MERKDKLTIERWELEEIIDSFRILVNAYPKIKERKSCLDRKLIESYARLIYLYNDGKYSLFKYTSLSKYVTISPVGSIVLSSIVSSLPSPKL